jgi:hypothetical protein
MSWVETGQCMAYKHNIFSLWGWLELGVAGGALVCLTYLVYRYKMKTAKYQQKNDRYLLASPGTGWRGAARHVYDNGVIIEQLE